MRVSQGLSNVNHNVKVLVIITSMLRKINICEMSGDVNMIARLMVYEKQKETVALFFMVLVFR